LAVRVQRVGSALIVPARGDWQPHAVIPHVQLAGRGHRDRPRPCAQSPHLRSATPALDRGAVLRAEQVHVGLVADHRRRRREDTLEARDEHGHEERTTRVMTPVRHRRRPGGDGQTTGMADCTGQTCQDCGTAMKQPLRREEERCTFVSPLSRSVRAPGMSAQTAASTRSRDGV
jgi:hypothetical protein